MINHLEKFTVKHKERDVIWTLRNLKTVPTGIYILGNKRVNYFSAIKYFVNMRQGNLKGDNIYIKRSISAIENLILDKERHMLYNSDIMKAADQANL